MLVPLSWLREFVPYEGSAEELGGRLTMLGLEMEGINHPFAGLEQIKVGYIAQCVPHPDSDHLHCCKVDIGCGELLDIVCGAPNVAEGQKVAVAPIGSRLPDGLVIRKAKLRGQLSCGMICSERELGLSEDHSGILVLPQSCDVGHTLLDALNLERDVLDLSITPNRPDCLSILGVAREVAMAWKLPFAVPELPLITLKKEETPEIPVTIESPDDCRLYAGRILSGIKIAQSPMRLRYRLHAVGVRPISNIVDITNYILFETGQPLHAFDLDRLRDHKIIVRRAKEGEELVTLDGKKRILSPADLCICDGSGPVALAGVMGGENSEITGETRIVFLESAVFNPRLIRKTAKRLGLSSEASFRFERGVDQQRSLWALDRASAMMASIAGAFVEPEMTLAEPKPFIPEKIGYRPARCNALLGCTIEKDRQKEILENDGCPVDEISSDSWVATQPSWRPDLTREADLVEEIARIYGVDAIPEKLPPVQKTFEDKPGRKTMIDFLYRIRHWAAGLGLHEAINYSFTAKKEIEKLNGDQVDLVTILNPLSGDQDAIRSSLAPGLLWDLQNNLAHEAQTIRLFEVASAFQKNPSSETGVCETPWLGILLYGLRYDAGYPRTAELFGYGDIKGIIENLFRFLNLPAPVTATQISHSFLHPCVPISIMGKLTGWMGSVAPVLARDWNAQKPVWMAELNLKILSDLNFSASACFEEPAVYPAIRRDMTVQVEAGLPAGEIVRQIREAQSSLLENVELIDIFSPEDKGMRNLTFRLTFRHPGRTLKDQEVDRDREKIAAFLRKELAAQI